MTIGVAISTHRRPAVLANTLAHWAPFLDAVETLVVVHDRMGEGVAATKNRCIAALMDAGVEHHFYADDDVYPISADWWMPYVEDCEPALCHCWGRSRLISEDGHYTTWNWPRGVVLYAERRVIDRVGGMRTDFGRWGGEHAEWSCRIHNAGLTRHRFADLSVAKRGVWFAEDYTRTVPSTVSARERKLSEKSRHELYERYRGSDDFVPYRTIPDGPPYVIGRDIHLGPKELVV